MMDVEQNRPVTLPLASNRAEALTPPPETGGGGALFVAAARGETDDANPPLVFLQLPDALPRIMDLALNNVKPKPIGIPILPRPSFCFSDCICIADLAASVCA